MSIPALMKNLSIEPRGLENIRSNVLKVTQQLVPSSSDSTPASNSSVKVQISKEGQKLQKNDTAIASSSYTHEIKNDNILTKVSEAATTVSESLVSYYNKGVDFYNKNLGTSGLIKAAGFVAGAAAVGVGGYLWSKKSLGSMSSSVGNYIPERLGKSAYDQALEKILSSSMIGDDFYKPYSSFPQMKGLTGYADHMSWDTKPVMDFSRKLFPTEI